MNIENTVPPSFFMWRRIHLTATAIVGLFALVHILLGVRVPAWSADAVWFVGAGLGLLLLSVINWSHVGLGPCDMPTAPAVRWANWGYAAFGLFAVAGIPALHAVVIALALVIQAIASTRTLAGPT